MWLSNSKLTITDHWIKYIFIAIILLGIIDFAQGKNWPYKIQFNL